MWNFLFNIIARSFFTFFTFFSISPVVFFHHFSELFILFLRKKSMLILTIYFSNILSEQLFYRRLYNVVE